MKQSKVGIPDKQMASPHTARFRDQVPSIVFLDHHLGSIVICVVTAGLQMHQYSRPQEEATRAQRSLTHFLKALARSDTNKFHTC